MNLGDREYFHQELMTFRSWMGERSFWENPEKTSNALKGLLH